MDESKTTQHTVHARTNKILPALTGVEKWTSYDMLRHCPSLEKLVTIVEGLAPTDSTVLVLGESGVGKELVADTLHQLSSRGPGPCIKVNCAALPENLADSLFFGHEKGAFTGALQTHTGFFEQANKGTMFLDEVAELSLLSQARLLRVLEMRSFRRVGGTRTLAADVRIIAATNRDLKAMVRQGKFREDLFYRLYVYPLTLQPLRQRREDIIPLAQLLHAQISSSRGMHNVPPLDAVHAAELCLQLWPGNVRQLRNVMERSLLEAMINHRPYVDFTTALQDDDPQFLHQYPLVGSGVSLKEINARAIASALRESKGRIQGVHGAATLLGVSPNTLRTKMKELGIPLPRQKNKKMPPLPPTP